VQTSRYFGNTIVIRYDRSEHEYEILSFVITTACSPLKVNRRFPRIMLAGFQRTTGCYIPADKTLPNHCCENLESYMNMEISKLNKSGGIIRRYCMERESLKMYNVCFIKPQLNSHNFHASETWTIAKRRQETFEVQRIKCLKPLAGSLRKDRIRNYIVRSR
jgi:hypothetical protein